MLTTKSKSEKLKSYVWGALCVLSVFIGPSRTEWSTESGEERLGTSEEKFAESLTKPKGEHPRATLWFFAAVWATTSLAIIYSLMEVLF